MGARTTLGLWPGQLLLLSLAVRTAVAGPLAQFMQKGSKEAHCHHHNVGTTAGSPMDCNRYTWPQGLAYPPPKIAAAERHPVMLVPSMIGSYIYRKNNGAAEPHYLCRTIKRGWKRIWPPAGTDLKCTDPSNIACLPEDWAPLLSECWGFDMTLAYNAKTNVYSSPPGLAVRVDAGLHIVCNKTEVIGEYTCLCDLMNAVGYTPHVDYDSLGYDWRVGPGFWRAKGAYFDKLKQRIEKLSRDNGGRTVAMVSFSLGSPVAALFLNSHVDVAWKNKYIQHWVSFSGTIGGVAQSLLQQMGGGLSDSGGGATHAYIPPNVVVGGTASFPQKLANKVFRSWGSQSWMGAMTPLDRVIVNSSGSARKSFTGAQIGAMFEDMGLPAQAAQNSFTRLSNSTAAPGVETYVLYGDGHWTPYAYEYPTSATDGARVDWSKVPKAYCEDGDGTGTLWSLAGVPRRWRTDPAQRGEPVHLFALKGLGHGGSTGDGYANYVFYQSLLRRVAAQPPADKEPCADWQLELLNKACEKFPNPADGTACSSECLKQANVILEPRSCALVDTESRRRAFGTILSAGQKALQALRPQAPTPPPTTAPTFGGSVHPIDTRRFSAASVTASINKLRSVCWRKKYLEYKKKKKAQG